MHRPHIRKPFGENISNYSDVINNPYTRKFGKTETVKMNKEEKTKILCDPAKYEEKKVSTKMKNMVYIPHA